jgi:hypothetical protein
MNFQLCDLNQIGAFMDWGMEKIFWFKEQARPMEKESAT